MDFEEAYRTIVKASKEQDTVEIPLILSCLDFNGKECLEIGGGVLARLSIKISEKTEVKYITCLENYDQTVEKSRKVVDGAGLSDRISVQMYKKENPYKLPFDNNSFDVVYGAWLPHELTTNEEFLNELTRVSRKHVLLIMPGIDDDITKMISIVRPGEKERRDGYKDQISKYLEGKGFKIDYKEATLKLDFENFDEIAGVFYCFDFKNWEADTASKDAVGHIGDKKEKIDEFLGNRVHNLQDGFYCLHGEK